MKTNIETISGHYAIQNLKEVDNLLSRLSDSDFTDKIESLSHFTIGNHVRHILEFYGCLLYQSKQGQISYDSRERNLILETQRSYARVYITDLISYILKNNRDQELFLEAKTGLGEDSITKFKSTFNRELYYCFEHGIHHQALIKVGLKEMNKEEIVSDSFGVAPSTIRYQLKTEIYESE